MAMDRIMPKDKDQKKFFDFQSDWYRTLESFITKGNKIQKQLKDSGAIAPTEILMFLLFWETINKIFKTEEINFIRHMLIDILENDDRFRREFIDQDNDIEFDITRLTMSKKKDTLH